MNYRHPNLKAGSLLLVTALAVAFVGGCKKADPIAGNWKDPKGNVIAFKADNTFSQGSGQTAATGKWTFADKKVSIHVETIGGKPAEEMFKQFSAMMTKMNPKAPAGEMEKLKTSMMSPVLSLSEDGKTLTMDGAPAGSNATLTKEETK